MDYSGFPLVVTGNVNEMTVVSFAENCEAWVSKYELLRFKPTV